VRSTFRRGAERPVIVESAVVDNPVVVAAEPARNAAGREQHLSVGVLVAAVVLGAPRAEVELDDPPTDPHVRAAELGIVPELRLVAAAPQLLRERRPLVRRVWLRADEDDPAGRIVRANALDCGSRGHAAADDQVLRGLHRPSPW